MNRILSSVLTVCSVALVAGCSPEAILSSDASPEASVQKRNGGASVARTYEVKIENLTGGQPFTPPLVATHQGATGLFDVGSPASLGIREIAENGNLGPMHMRLLSDPHVSEVFIAVAGSPPPLMPGAYVTFSIDAAPGARFLSFASMLICTNDGFTGLDSGRLPSGVGETSMRDLNAYDAGSEINTEDFADIVPPCPALTGVMSSDPGTGMSNPTLAENGVIGMHPGIAGTDDLQTAIHGFTNPVGRMTITRTN